MPKQTSQQPNMEPDSSKQEFWDMRYATEATPWDFQGVPQRLRDYLSGAHPGRVLIPGCGSGYEVAAFHAAGWSVTAIDFSAQAVERAKRLLGCLGDLVVCGDFFRHPLGNSTFDVVYERTFLCALPPRMWQDYAKRVSQLIHVHGTLIGFFLYGEEPDPPPYPLTEQMAADLFARNFVLNQDEFVSDSLPVFAGKERWQEWAKVQ
jgi:SAM-dependent methyltransferase